MASMAVIGRPRQQVGRVASSSWGGDHASFVNSFFLCVSARPSSHFNAPKSELEGTTPSAPPPANVSTSRMLALRLFPPQAYHCRHVGITRPAQAAIRGS